MRVANFMQKCAAFIGKTRNGKFEPIATGFFVAYPYKDGACQYFVTAAHCVISEQDLQIRVNMRNGQSDIRDLPSDKWIIHPDPNRFVDVAAMVSAISPLIYDIEQISLTKDIASDTVIDRWDIGIGDEVFFPGLFVHHSGRGRNLPIIRSGIISAMKDEPLETRDGHMNAYLVEARSIGGHSGSPVFVNMLAERQFRREKMKPLPLPGERRDYYFLGLLRGHFLAKDSGEYFSQDPEKNLWVNSGIAIVIPAQDILDVLSQTELDEAREEAWRAARARQVDVPDVT